LMLPARHSGRGGHRTADPASSSVARCRCRCLQPDCRGTSLPHRFGVTSAPVSHGSGSPMATLIPNRGSCLSRMRPGERRFSACRDDKLDDEYLCWYGVPIGPRYRHPDFVVLHPSRGCRVLEVKDWKAETLAELDRDRAVIDTDRGRVTAPNPL